MCVPVPKQSSQTQEKPEDITLIPDQQVVLNNINTLLVKYNIKVIHIPVKKNINILRPIKDKLHLKVKSIYSSPCVHGKVYSWTDGKTVKTNGKEHICLGQPEKSRVEEQILK
jgi:hypothetical protein